MKTVFNTLFVSILVISLVLGVNVILPKNPAHAMSGSGTPEDPYIITDVYELQAMELNLSGHYELGNDIDAACGQLRRRIIER